MYLLSISCPNYTETGSQQHKCQNIYLTELQRQLHYADIFRNSHLGTDRNKSSWNFTFHFVCVQFVWAATELSPIKVANTLTPRLLYATTSESTKAATTPAYTQSAAAHLYKNINWTRQQPHCLVTCLFSHVLPYRLASNIWELRLLPHFQTQQNCNCMWLHQLCYHTLLNLAWQT